MKAPKKIYLYPSDKAGEEYEAEWGDKPWGEDYAEYTRTDTFIEKACEYINKLIDIPHNIECADNGEPLANSYIDYAKERLEVVNKIIEDFKKYMKGE